MKSETRNEVTNRMLIILTTGPEDRGNRATLAFSLGLSALVSGVEVTLYATMGGTFWARRPALQTVHIEGFEPLARYADEFVEAGGKLLVCSPCNAFYCSIGGDSALLPGASLAGLATVTDLAMNSSVVTL